MSLFINFFKFWLFLKESGHVKDSTSENLCFDYWSDNYLRRVSTVGVTTRLYRWTCPLRNCNCNYILFSNIPYKILSYINPVHVYIILQSNKIVVTILRCHDWRTVGQFLIKPALLGVLSIESVSDCLNLASQVWTCRNIAAFLTLYPHLHPASQSSFLFNKLCFYTTMPYWPSLFSQNGRISRVI